MRQTKTLFAATIFGLFSLYLCACQNQGASKTGTGTTNSSESLTPSGGLSDLANSLDTAASSASGDEKTALQDASSSVSDLATASKSAENFNGSNGSGVENALEAALARIKSSADNFQQLQAYQAFQQALYRIYYTRNIYRWKHPTTGAFAYTRNLGADSLPFIQGGFAFLGVAFRVFKEQRGPELSLSIPLVDVYRCHVPGVKWKIVFNNDANAACEGQTQEKVLLGKVSAGYTSWSVFRIFRAVLPNNENASLSLNGHNARVAAGWADKKDEPVVYSAN